MIDDEYVHDLREENDKVRAVVQAFYDGKEGLPESMVKLRNILNIKANPQP